MNLPHYETLDEYIPTDGIVVADIFGETTWILIVENSQIANFYFLKGRSIKRLLRYLKNKFKLKPDDIIYLDETEELLDIDILLSRGKLLTSL